MTISFGASMGYLGPAGLSIATIFTHGYTKCALRVTPFFKLLHMNGGIRSKTSTTLSAPTAEEGAPPVPSETMGLFKLPPTKSMSMGAVADAFGGRHVHSI
jgi:hypothetical protein